jgi:hypothetical protein
MNFWIFKPSFLDAMDIGFKKFMHQKGAELKSEYYFNAQANNMIKTGEAVTKVLHTNTKWFGITYREDRPMVQQSIMNLIEAGVYPENLWKQNN